MDVIMFKKKATCVLLLSSNSNVLNKNDKSSCSKRFYKCCRRLIGSDNYIELLKIIVGGLTTCHTQYT